MATLDPSKAAARERFLAEYSNNAPASKWEVWSYYSYATGCNQLGLVAFAPTILQYLISLQMGDGSTLNFLGVERSINSIILYSNGMAFAVQVVVMMLCGSFADYGTWRPWLLIFWTVVCWCLGFSWLGIQTPEKWQVAIGIYIIGAIASSMCQIFYLAAFPRLARNTSQVRDKAEQYQSGGITEEEYELAETKEKTKVANLTFIIQSAGQIVILAIAIGILFAIKVTDSVENNLWGYGVVVAYLTAVWILLSVPWFALEKKRPGQQVPDGFNIFTVGFWQLYRALSHLWRLKQVSVYLMVFILLGDSLGTCYVITQTLRNEVLNYDALTITYQQMIYCASLVAGIWAFWAAQKYFKLAPKTMVNISVSSVVVLCGWGMIGIWTQNFGFHNAWEFWLFQVIYGFFACPWYSYSLVVLSQLLPRGKEFLFFSLFNVVSMATGFVAPFISGAIIDADTKPDKPGNNSLPFYFLFGIAILTLVLLVFFVDVDKAKLEQAAFLEAEEQAKRKFAGDSNTTTDEHGLETMQKQAKSEVKSVSVQEDGSGKV